MRLKTSYAMGEGKYYFVIKAIPNNITISRKNKKSAVDAYRRYKLLGKDIEWLGKWDGKKFVEVAPPGVAA